MIESAGIRCAVTRGGVLVGGGVREEREIIMDWKRWRRHEKTWIVGCIAHDGSITAKAFVLGQGTPQHDAETSRGKRWRWNVPNQDFCATLDSWGTTRMDKEECAAVIDWLIRNGYADEENYPTLETAVQ